MFDETLSVLTEQIEDLPLRPADQTPEIGEQCKRAALIYAGMGARVVPLHYVAYGGCSCDNPACRAPGAHPIMSLLPHGLQSASRDPEVIKRWWAAQATGKA